MFNSLGDRFLAETDQIVINYFYFIFFFGLYFSVGQDSSTLQMCCDELGLALKLESRVT